LPVDHRGTATAVKDSGLVQVAASISEGTDPNVRYLIQVEQCKEVWSSRNTYVNKAENEKIIRIVRRGGFPLAF
jgi:hypothetical protein